MNFASLNFHNVSLSNKCPRRAFFVGAEVEERTPQLWLPFHLKPSLLVSLQESNLFPDCPFRLKRHLSPPNLIAVTSSRALIKMQLQKYNMEPSYLVSVTFLFWAAMTLSCPAFFVCMVDDLLVLYLLLGG